MSDRRTVVLDERDIIVRCDGTREGVHGAILQVNDLAKRRVAAAPERVDADTGEIKQRTWRLIFGEDNEDITAKQRGFFHAAVLPQIAEQANVNGVRYAAKVWKEFYRQRFLGDKYVSDCVPRWDAKQCRLVQPKRKTPRRVRISTEDLACRQYAEHIDKVIAAAETELGVVFEFDQQEREACRYVKPTRKTTKAARAVETEGQTT